MKSFQVSRNICSVADLAKSVRPLHLSDQELLKICVERRSRASTKGGQAANKTETGIEILHPGSGVKALSNQHRELQRNRQEALRNLRLKLAYEVIYCTPRDFLFLSVNFLAVSRY